MAYQSIFGPDEKVDNSGGYRSLFDTEESYEGKRKKRRDEIAQKMVQEQEAKQKKEEQSRQEREKQAKEKKEYESRDGSKMGWWERNVVDKVSQNTELDRYKREQQFKGSQEKAKKELQSFDQILSPYSNESRKAITEYELAQRQIEFDKAKEKAAKEGSGFVRNKLDENTPQDVLSRLAKGKTNQAIPEALAEGQNRGLLGKTLGPLVGAAANIAGKVDTGITSFTGGLIEQYNGGILEDPLNKLGRGIQDLAKKKDIMYTKAIDESRFSTRSRAGEGEFLVKLSSGAGSLVPSIGAALVGHPWVGAAAFGTASGGDVYRESRDAGKSNLSALVLGGVDGVIQTATERVGVGGLIKNAGTGPIASRLLKGFLIESSQEFTQSMSNSAIQEFYKDVEWDKAIKQAFEEGGYGGLLGASTGGVGFTYEQAMKDPKLGALLQLNFSRAAREKAVEKGLAPPDTISDTEIAIAEDIANQPVTKTLEGPQDVMDSVVDIVPPPSGLSDIPGTNIDTEQDVQQAEEIAPEASIDQAARDEAEIAKAREVNKPREGDEIQTKIEQAANANNYSEVKSLIESMPEGELRKGMESSFDYKNLDSRIEKIKSESTLEVKETVKPERKGEVKTLAQSNQADISIVYPESSDLPANLKDNMPGNDVALTAKTVDGKDLVVTRKDMESRSNIITMLKKEAVRISKKTKNLNATTKYKNLDVRTATAEQLAELSTYVTGKPKLGTVDYTKNKPILRDTKSLTQSETEKVIQSSVMPKSTTSAIVKLLPDVAKGKNVTVTKDKNGEVYFSYESKNGSVTNTGRISAKSMGLNQERLNAIGVKEGMTVDLSDVTKNTNKVPVIRNNKTNVEGMSVDATSGQGNVKFNKDVSIKQERSRDTQGKYANENPVDSFKTILKNNVTGDIAKSADLKKEVLQYQGNSQNVNRWLATHNESSKFFESSTEMDAAFTQELTKPIKLYRTISKDFYGILEGNKTFTDKTYGSSTLSLQEARSAVYGDIILSFTAPAGQKVIVPDMYSGSIDTISQYSQTEFILPRNMTYKVISVTKTDGRTMVQAELVNSIPSTENTETMATESTMSEAEAFKQRSQLTRKQVARDTLEEQTLSVKDAEKLESVNAIIEFLSDYFTVIKRGRMQMKKALGEHHTKTEVIRIQKTIGDNIVEGGRLGVAVHEVGHNLAKNIPEFNIIKGSGISILGKEGNADLSSISTKPNDAALSGVYGEGFAEFIRYYVINPAAVKQKMPNTYKIIDKTLKDKYPHQYRGLMRARTMWNVDQKLSATKKTMSSISYSDKKSSLAERAKDGLERTYKHWVDDLYPVEKLEKMVEKSGVKIAIKDKASTLMMLNRGSAGKGKAFLEWGTFGFNPYSKNAENGKYEVERKGKSFKEITQAIYQNGQEAEFDAYLAAKRSLALYQDRGIIQPISQEVAKATIKEQEQKHPHFVKAQEELVKFQDAVIDYITEAGMIAKENVQLMRQMNRDYVPLFKVMENAAASGQMGKGYANLQSGLKKIKGSELQIISPMESIVKNTYSLIQAADANSAMQALANMAKLSPEIAGQIFEKVKTPMTKAASVKLSDLGIVSAEKTIGNGFVTDFDVDQTINLFRPLFRDDSGQVVSVMIKGKPEFFQVSDPAIYKAITQMSERDANIITKILTTPASLLRAGATLTPDFVFRNPVRDQFSAFVYSKTGFIPVVDSARGLASVAAKDNDYWMWQISGGAYATLVSVDRSYIRDETRKVLKTKPLRAKLNIVNGLREVSELMEETTRMGEYKKAIKDRKGLFVKNQAMHPLEAAIASKEITLNFSRRGDYGKNVNSVVAFFNAGVQDIDKMARELKTHPVRTTTKATLAITLPAILLFLANRDEEWYKEIPTWQKDQFFIFKINNQIVKIPKPFLLGTIFATLPERALGELLDDNSRNMKGVGGYLSGALPDWIPTGIKPLVEVVTNYDMFGNRPIVPRAEEYFDKSEQYGSYTSETAKILNKLTGNKLSPREWDQLIKGYTAGLGQYAVQTADTLMDRVGLVNRPDKPKGSTRNIPVIKGFTIDEPRGGSSQSVTNFYEASRRATKAETTYNKMIDEGRTKEAMEYKKSHPEMDLATQYRTIQKSLSDLKNASEKARTSKTLSPQEKSDIIAEAERQMTFISKSALQFDPKYTSNSKTTRQPKSTEYDDKISEAAYNNDYQKARDLAEEHNRKIDEYVKDLGNISDKEREKWEEKKINVTVETLNRRRKYQQEKRNQ